MKYAYFPGCSLHSTASEYEMSVKAVVKSLDVELVTIPDWVCCGASSGHGSDELQALALPIKNLVWPEREKLGIVTPCASCFSKLKISNTEVKNDAELLKKVNEIIGENYTGNVDIKHILEVVYSNSADIKKNLKLSLNGLKAVCYYGCLLNRPRKLSIEEDFEDPIYMDTLMQLIGVNVLNWEYKTECCGASFSITNTDIALELCNKILRDAEEVGAECIIVACPMCHANLDMRQEDISKSINSGYQGKMPIVYFTQLLGLVFGIEVKSLGLNKHFIDPIKLLESYTKAAQL